MFSFIFILSFISSSFSNDIDKEYTLLISEGNEPFLSFKKDKYFTAKYIDTSISIDGNLIENFWIDFESSLLKDSYISDFIQESPENMLDPSFKTFVKIGFDSENIYIGAKFFDSSPDSIQKRLARRDDYHGAFSNLSDWFSIEFDSNHNHKTGYLYAVNASGVQLDAMVYSDSDYDLEYNGVWESSVQIVKDGWQVEMKIPFKMLNITQLENPWGLNIHRFIFRKSETDRWVVLPMDTPGISSQYGHVFGFKEMRIDKTIEFMPYAIGGYTSYNNHLLLDNQLFPDSYLPIDKGNYANNSLGLDLKYRLSASSALDLTIKPDFGQIEMDPEYINLTYYEILLDEKRRFFNETKMIFETPISIFYSRRIGASFENIDYQINTALKYIGKNKLGLDYGVLLAHTSPIENDLDRNLGSNKYLINRITKNIFGNSSTLGFSSSYFLNNNSQSATQSAIFSIDNISYFLSNSLIIDYQFVKSYKGVQEIEDEVEGIGYTLNMDYSSSFPISFEVDVEIYDENFDINDIGYLERNNMKRYQVDLRYKLIDPFFNQIREIYIDLFHEKSVNYNNLTLNNNIGFKSTLISKKYNLVNFGYKISKESYDDYYTYDYELGLNGPPFLKPELQISFIEFLSTPGKKLSFYMGIESAKSFINDNLLKIKGSLVSRFGHSYLVQLNYIRLERHAQYSFLEIQIEDNTDKEHYIFATTNGWEDRYSIKIEKYFNNQLSLQLYSEYFLHFNKYTNYMELELGNRWPQVTSYITGSTIPGNYQDSLYTSENNEPSIEYDDEGNIEVSQELNPNNYIGFYPKFTNLNFNLSLKWQYGKNSEIYIIYKLERSINGEVIKSIKDFIFYNEGGDWIEKYFDTFFYIKFNYWFDM